jgi:hypothetical protein
MANLYVASTGSNTPPYDTWANAATNPATAVNAAVAGDTVYIHAESFTQGVDTTWTLAGTISNPVNVICTNDKANEPPTVLASKGVAKYTQTSSWDFVINGIGYIYGFGYENTIQSSNALILGLAQTTNDYIILDNFTHSVISTSTSTSVTIGTGQDLATRVQLLNSSFSLNNSSGLKFTLWGDLYIRGGSISSNSNLSQTFNAAGRRAELKVIDCDLSGLGSSTLIAASSSVVFFKCEFVNCKLNQNTVVATNFTNASQAEVTLTNCASSGINYNSARYNVYGTLLPETVLVKTNGASDGSTPISWKLTTTANATESIPFITGDMAVWIDSTSASKTITVDILHDSVTALKDNEVWLEIDYLGSSSSPLGTPASDKRATVLTTAVDQSSSSANWTTTGMSNPNKQKLEVSFTPQMKGFVYARVCVAKPSYTLYVDPKPLVN